MLLGAHVSIAGGVEKAPARAAELGCTAMQIFTKSQLQWKAPALTENEIQAFKEQLQLRQIKATCVHDSYLINLGSPDSALLEKSRRAFSDEIRRTGQLEIPYLVFHPGSFKEGDLATCLKTIAQSINDCLDRSGVTSVRLLLETTAGQGTNVGRRFEELAEIISLVHRPENVGICLDTAHIFAAGYDIRTYESYLQTIETCEKVVGLEKLKVIHLNDSRKPPGSRVDRHENIGLGQIGLDAFRFIMNDPRFHQVLKILETPGGEQWYQRNITLLKSLVEGDANLK